MISMISHRFYHVAIMLICEVDTAQTFGDPHCGLYKLKIQEGRRSSANFQVYADGGPGSSSSRWVGRTML